MQSNSDFKSKILHLLIFATALQIFLLLLDNFILRLHFAEPSNLLPLLASLIFYPLPYLIASSVLFAIYKKSNLLHNCLKINLFYTLWDLILKIVFLFRAKIFYYDGVYSAQLICALAIVALTLLYFWKLKHIKREENFNSSTITNYGFLGSIPFILFLVITDIIFSIYLLSTQQTLTFELIFQLSFTIHISFILLLIIAVLYLNRWINLPLWALLIISLQPLLSLAHLFVTNQLGNYQIQSSIIFSFLITAALARYLWKDRQRPIFPIFRS